MRERLPSLESRLVDALARRLAADAPQGPANPEPGWSADLLRADADLERWYAVWKAHGEPALGRVLLAAAEQDLLAPQTALALGAAAARAEFELERAGRALVRACRRVAETPSLGLPRTPYHRLSVAALALSLSCLLLASAPVQQATGSAPPPPEPPEMVAAEGAWSELDPGARAPAQAALRWLDRQPASLPLLRRVFAHRGTTRLARVDGPWRWRAEPPLDPLSRKAMRLVRELPADGAYVLRTLVSREGWRLEAVRRPAQVEPPPVVRLALTGDVMFAGDLLGLVRLRGAGWPWEAVRPLLDTCDGAIVNLENPLSAGGTPTPLKLTSELRAKREFIFFGPPAVARPMAEAGVVAATIGNNHSIDQGADGLKQTRQALIGAGIATTGAGADLDEALVPAVVTLRGVRIAVVAFCGADTLPRPTTFEATAARAGVAMLHVGADGRLAAASRERLVEQVRRAMRIADIVLVALHAGRESREVPTPFQRDVAHTAVEAGADVFVGHHPHCLQPLEWYQGRPLIYSLGNFVFSGYDLRKLWETALVRLTVTPDGVAEVELAPIWIETCRPHPADDPITVQAVAARLAPVSGP